eukprot:6118098-Alexandrium_andersonii.AAC.1
MVKQVKLQKQKEKGEEGFAPGAVPGAAQPPTPAHLVVAAGGNRSGSIYSYIMGPTRNHAWGKDLTTEPMFMEDSAPNQEMLS